MKKILIIALSLMATFVYSDIEVDWYQTGFVADEGNAWDTDLLLTQLLWSKNTPTGIALVGGVNEASVFTLDVMNVSYGSFDTDGLESYLTGALTTGGDPINTGYLFSRVWNAEKTYYWQSATIGNVLPNSADEPAPLPITAKFLEATDLVHTDIQAVPEPTVIALLGAGGLVMLVGRRMKFT